MKILTVIYSPLCEANGSFIENLKNWLHGQDVEIQVYPFHLAPEEYKESIKAEGNCFIDVFYEGKKIDSVPLHREKLLSTLGFEKESVTLNSSFGSSNVAHFSVDDFRKQLYSGKVDFIPITKNTYPEEMSMCLCNYPMGNPPKEHHLNCIEIKAKVFGEIFEKEKVAGIYAKSGEMVVGLLEVIPREIVRKYGYMTGTKRADTDILTVGCYEIAAGIPRTLMIDELMYQLLKIKGLFSRKYLEGIGILAWEDGFNPYWVYEKYEFRNTEQKSDHVFVMERLL